MSKEMFKEHSDWEKKLLKMAYRAFESHITTDPLDVDSSALDKAYRYCKLLTKKQSYTCYLASKFLPSQKQRSIRALFAFCSVGKDLKNSPEKNKASVLNNWYRMAICNRPDRNNPIALAWTDTRINYKIPIGYSLQLIDGIARDLNVSNYLTFDSLAEYCYEVASTIALMAMHIVGFKSVEAIPYILKMGVALQLCKILEDFRYNLKTNKVYLPLEEITRFGVKLKDNSLFVRNDAWIDAIGYQVNKVRRLCDEALPGINFLNPDGRFAAAIVIELNRAVLDNIEKHGYDLFDVDVSMNKYQKLCKLPSIWWRSRRMYPRYFPEESSHARVLNK